jgi:biotin transporter BioY
MPSPTCIYQDIIILAVSVSIRIYPSKFINITMWNIVLLTTKLLDEAKFSTLTPLSLLISCKFSFPVVGLKKSSLSTLALKSPKKIHIIFGELANTRSSAS